MNPIVTISPSDESQVPNTVRFYAGNSVEMLRISPEGFWVRGVKVNQGSKESKQVYQAFTEWLAWTRLQQ